MIVISDTNILSSLASASALKLLFDLYPSANIYIPPAVYQELQAGYTCGYRYLSPVLQAINEHKIEVLGLSATEKSLMLPMPKKLNAGECEAIALSQIHQGTLLSNDKRAIRYCEKQNVEALNLADLLRLLWIKRFITQKEVKSLIAKMNAIEGLILSQAALNTVFAPHSG